MRFASVFMLCFIGLTACNRGPTVELPDGFCAQLDMRTGPPPDMTPPPAPCPAAKGVGGDNLFCVDFMKVNQLSDLTGWDFSNPGGCPGWEIAGGKLQIKMFGSFANTCSFTLPSVDLNAADKQKYQSVALSVIQTMDLDPGTLSPNQYAFIYLDAVNPTRLVSQATGTQFAEQQLVFSIDKSNLPGALNNAYQWLFQVTSATANNTKQGLQISSIAVNLQQ